MHHDSVSIFINDILFKTYNYDVSTGEQWCGQGNDWNELFVSETFEVPHFISTLSVKLIGTFNEDPLNVVAL